MNTGIFHKGSEAPEMACTLVVKQNSVYIYFNIPGNSLLIWNLKQVYSCVWEGSVLKIQNKSGIPEVLSCSGTIAEAIYEAYKNPVPEITSTRRPLVSYAPFFISLSVFIIIGTLAYLLLLPWLSRQLVRLIPVSTEIQLGEALSKQYTREYHDSDSASFYANRFCSQLNLKTIYPVKLTVLQSNELNAFALPGGRIFIYSGLLKKLQSYEELAALIGHEVSHVSHRHSLKSILNTAASGLLISAVLGDAAGISSWVLSRADEFKQLNYSRELETEADNEGFHVLLQNNINPQGMLNLLELLKREGQEMPALMKYLSTHPDTQERIDNIQTKIVRNKSYPVNNALAQCFQKLKAVREEF